jgi:hypothetical protein
MASPLSFAQRARLAHDVRARLVAEARKALVPLAVAIDERFVASMNEAAPSKEMQIRRDAWTVFQREQKSWKERIEGAWTLALQPPVAAVKKPLNEELELIGTEVVENRILVSRLVQSLIEKANAEVNDLGQRVKHLEGTQEIEPGDVLRPDTLLLPVIEQWGNVGLPREAWAVVNEVVQKLLVEQLKQAFAQCNRFLIDAGVMPTIQVDARVKRASSAAPQRSTSSGPSSATTPLSINSESASLGPQSGPGPSANDNNSGGAAGVSSQTQAHPSRTGEPSTPRSNAFGGRLGWGRGNLGSTSSRSAAGPMGERGASTSAPAPAESASQSVGRHSSGYGGTSDETRLMTSSTPLARARSRALGVMGQLKRLLVGSAEVNFDTEVQALPSPALAAAIAYQPRPAAEYGGGDTVMEDFSPAGVAKVAVELRRTTSELKQKAETKNEKAIIEIVALMFQAILQEDRIPPGVRVWFARLQMPVLRVALAEPDFFSTLNHPARQLIDRMGSCVMGFDDNSVNSSVLQAEIKRVVQVIEQYPETGKRVYQLVYDEFQKFLSKFLTGSDATKKVVSVAQQVEQKETLTIQYTIEMRNMLKDMPVREEIREFLFKVWAEVLAVSAVRKGPRHAETLELKKSATDVVWAASAKPNRADRARVIQDLPQLLQKLRSGMSLLGLAPSVQDAHIKIVSDTLADAFMSKTQAIPAEQIKAMAERLERLEDFVSEDGMGDLPLDAESIELMLGIDASTIVVVSNGGSLPNAAMLAWAQELQLGSWFTLDHNDRVIQVQLLWRSERKHLQLLASADGRSYLIQAGRLAAYLQAGLLLPQEEETLTVRATRDALVKLEANPERLLS